jgi:hypothetical protein
MDSEAPKRRNEAQAKLQAARLKPVKLRVAAAILHHQLGGGHRASMLGAQYIEHLNAAAAMLSEVLDLYRLQPGNAMIALSKEELAGATFLDGGNVVRTAAGTLYYPLAVRRSEAIAAIGHLTDARAVTG